MRCGKRDPEAGCSSRPASRTPSGQLGGPARILLVHANDSFLAAVRQIGRPATETDMAEITQDLTLEELDRAFAAHGITNVGPPIEQAEAEGLLGQLAGAAIPT
jgi:hypothetical protein